jgi:RHS repeat-associated protein
MDREPLFEGIGFANGKRVRRFSVVAVGAVAVALFGSACREAPRAPAPAAEPAVERRSAALTVLPRTGWVASAMPAGGTNVAANAIDGNASTRWATGTNQVSGTSQWFRVDMGAPRTFNALRLDTTATPTDYPRGYSVAVSSDGNTWGAAIATGTVASSNGPIVHIAFPAQTARWVRVTQTQAASSWWSIHEFNVYDNAQPTVPTAQPRVGWTSTASASSNPTANALDGDTMSGWTSTSIQVGAPVQSALFFRVDMLTLRTFDQITLDSGSADESPHAFKVETSNDNVRWTTIVPAATGNTALVTVTLPTPTTARYIKITLTDNDPHPWTIRELNVIGPALSRLAWPVRASSTGGSNFANNALDGSTSTRWTTSAAQTGVTFDVDMGVTQVFNQITLDAGSSTSNNFPRAYDVFVSSNGTTWGTRIANGTGTTRLTTINFNNLATQSARFVRIRQTATNSTPWTIEEMNVWRIGQPCDAGCTAMDSCHTVGTCNLNTGACSNPNATNGITCNDNNTCTGSSTCQAGVCTGSNPVANGTLCNDNNACTGSSTCQAGVCTGASPVSCNAPPACRTATGAVCNPNNGQCTYPNVSNGTTCNDNDACTGTSSCQNGTCTGASPVVCNSPPACHTATGATCNPTDGQCSYPDATNGSTCDDGNLCTTTSSCQAGVCTGANPVVCNLPPACHIATGATCNPATGACDYPNEANGTNCDDGNLCTATSSCQAGICTGASPVVCTALDQCHVAGTCNPATGQCSNPNATNGTNCNDNNACTGTSSCQGGICTGANPVACTASDQCHVAGTCDPANGQCSNPVKLEQGAGSYWSSRAEMATPRYAPAGVAFGGLSYVFGGCNAPPCGEAYTPTVEVYDPAQDVWSPRAPMPTARHAAQAATIDGTIYVVGGLGVASLGGLPLGTPIVEAYDPASDSWTTRASMHIGRMSPAIGVIGSEIYVAGGHCCDSHGVIPPDFVESYDPATNTWTTRGPTPIDRFAPASGVIGGKLYVAGGLAPDRTLLDRLDVYDPATDSWTSLRRMPSALEGPGAEVVDGKLFVFGGTTASSNLPHATFNQVYVYDPPSNSWSIGPTMPTPRYGASATVAGDKILLAGGYASGGPTTVTEALSTLRGGACNDSNVCTLADACVAGTCNGAPVAGASLMAGLPTSGMIADGTAGWNRVPATQSTGDYWHQWSVTGKVDGGGLPYVDVFYRDNTPNNTMYVTRDLGTPSNSTERWELNMDVSYTPMTNHGDCSGQRLEVLDDAGKVIARFFPEMFDPYPEDARFVANGAFIARNDLHHFMNYTMAAWGRLRIFGANGQVTFKYGSYPPVTTAPLDPTANWRRAKTFRLFFWTNDAAWCAYAAGAKVRDLKLVTNTASDLSLVLDDGDACTADACNAQTGVSHGPAAAGTACPDGDLCNGAETCNGSGVCQAGTPIAPAQITDNNTCTNDMCNSSGGIQHNPVTNGTTCNDGNVCTIGDTCQAGTCTAGSVTSPACNLPPGLTPAQIETARQAGLVIPAYATLAGFEPVFPERNATTVGLAINNSGVIAGYSHTNQADYPIGQMADAHFVTPSGQVTALSRPSTWTGPDSPSYAVDVNDSGVILGEGGPRTYAAGFNFLNPIVWTPDGSNHQLPWVSAKPGMQVYSMNNTVGSAGLPTIVGTSVSFIWVDPLSGTLDAWHLDNGGDDVIGPSHFTDLASVTWGPGHTPGAGDAAAEFDGNGCLKTTTVTPTGDHYPNSTNVSLGMTMMAWVKPNQTICDSMGRFAIASRGQEFSIWLECVAPGAPARLTAFSRTTTGDHWTTAVGSIPLGEWSHVAVTWDKAKVRSFVRGQWAADHPLDGNINRISEWVAVGCWGSVSAPLPTANFRGAIDEVSISLHGMGADEIARAERNLTNYRAIAPLHGNQWVRIEDGFFNAIVTPSDPIYSGNGTALRVNDAGMIVGYQTLVGGALTAMMYTPSGGWQNLNQLVANGVLGLENNWDLQVAHDIDAQGHFVIGDGVFHGRKMPFRLDTWTGDVLALGRIEEFPLDWPPYEPEVRLSARSMNAQGHIVGFVGATSWPYNRAFLYTDGTGLVDLNDVIDPTAGWLLLDAYSINDNDEIVGWGMQGNPWGSPQTHRAYKLSLPGLPSTAQTACIGKADGDACSNTGTLCGSNSVCQAGVCGGASSHVCLIADGVVEVEDGHYVAVFGFDNASVNSTHPAVNQALLDGAVVSNPNPAPPAWLGSGTHRGAYFPAFSSGQTAGWRVDGQMVTASASSPRLPKVAIGTGGYGVMIGGQLLTIVPDLAPYQSPPDDPVAQTEPTWENEFPGTLAGNLSVGPSGAAIYTVPIAIPPGVAGMAPNLSLVYNSQGGDGVAGQGWELTGLSMIHRCPRTVIQDGEARQVRLNDLDDPFGKDGICLDGKRLFERTTSCPSGATCYESESQDFSQIRRYRDPFSTDPSDVFFVVTTKSDETRYYGLTTRVTRAHFFPTGDPETIIWTLDKVIDTWGNYFNVTYNEGAADFATSGLHVSEIAYTGHLTGGTWNGIGSPTGLEPEVQPPRRVTFFYESRPDVRHMRFGSVSLPKNLRLKSITTWYLNAQLGTYTIDYQASAPPNDILLPSRLERIRYCASEIGPSEPQETGCLDPLEFDWDWSNYRWEQVPHASDVGQDDSYDLPASIDSYFDDDQWRTRGTQLIDLNGDGRADFVLARDTISRAWENNGHGWTERPNWALPAMLTNASGFRVGSLFADIDGDGRQDYVNSRSPTHNCTLSGADDQLCIWINRIHENPGCAPSACWQLSTALRTVSPTFRALRADPEDPGLGNVDFTKVYKLADMNADGRADLFRTGPGDYQIQVLLNFSSGWAWPPATKNYNWPFGGAFTSQLALGDVNRDGLPDFGGAINLGVNGSTNTVWEMAAVAPDPNAPLGGPPGSRIRGDVDGDGLFDSVWYFSAGSPSEYLNLAFATGTGFTNSGTTGYEASIPRPTTLAAKTFTMTDLNGDGLADFVKAEPAESIITHEPQVGKPFINTGTAWVQIYTGTPVGLADVRTVPGIQTEGGPDNGTVFLDLDGDGITDIAKASTTESSLGSWLNKTRPPVIIKFPNGLARKSEVTYEVITTPAAQTSSAPIYSDTLPVEAGTSRMIVPMRVVASLWVEDGTGTGQLAETKYQYEALRASKAMRGPQGFKRVTVTDPAQIATVTTYAQVYPYTGLPTSVVRRYNLGGAPPAGTPVTLSATTTCYCDTIAESGGGLQCAPMSDLDPADCPHRNIPAFGGYPSRTSLFVYPAKVIDTSYLQKGEIPQRLNPDHLKTTSDFRYDDAGNPLSTTVTAEKLGTNPEKHRSTTVNTYNGALAKRLGKVTRTEVTTQRLEPADGNNTALLHVTAFEYGTVNYVQRNLPDASFTETFALKRKKLEPDVTGPALALKLYTAYGYDRFGNVTLTTECASDFENCAPGALGPPELSYRTTSISYNPSDYNVPAGQGIATSLSYGKGVFPVMKTNPQGHREFFAYNRERATLRHRTDPNGIHTCFTYDDFGTQRSETARCGTNDAITTNLRRYRATPSDPARSRVVMVTSPPTGATTWAYTDVFGRAIETRGRSFAGGFTQSTASYDRLGRLDTETKPRDLVVGSMYRIIRGYDEIGRLRTVTQELGRIDETGNPAVSVARTSYEGSEVTMVDANGHTRVETKNVLGKLAAVTDADGITLRYRYDADGNLTEVGNPNNTAIPTTQIHYIGLGRKDYTIDPDMGEWRYEYNSFGDLTKQRDAKGVETTMLYDNLGRMMQKSSGPEYTYWLYDYAPGAVGKLIGIIGPDDPRLTGQCATPYDGDLPPGNHATKWFSYTTYGEVQEEFQCTDGDTFSTQYDYDGLGRRTVVRYPEVNSARLAVNYHYTNLGFLQHLREGASGPMYWAATEMNAIGQVTKEITGNGVETISIHNPSTGWLLNSNSTAHADGDRHIQDWSYGYDKVGNLKKRKRADVLAPGTSEETFDYDSLDRLLTSRVRIPSQNYDVSTPYGYDALGNLTSKAGKEYTYTGCQTPSRAAGPHAVCTFDGSGDFSYDDNGNLLAGNGRNITYNRENRATQIDGPGGREVEFVYGGDGNRVLQSVDSITRTFYVGLGATGKSLYERTASNGSVEHVQFIYTGAGSGGTATALRVTKGATPPSLKYHHFDHLGSVTAMSDERGRVQDSAWGPDAQVMSYDAWGDRRSPDWRPGTTTPNLQVGHRDFTGHEAIPGVGLVNMNGRIYDPKIGRFLTPDPHIQFIADLQSYNRYSYVLNNPLRYTDPTGYMSFGLNSSTMSGIFTMVTLTGMCVFGGPGGCVAAAIIGASYTAASMQAQGATNDQIVQVVAIGMFAGAVGGAIGGAVAGQFVDDLGAQFVAHLVGGAISGGISGAVSTAVTGGSLGENIFGGMAQGIAMAGVSFGIKQLAPVTQAAVQGDPGESNAGYGKGGAHPRPAPGTARALTPDETKLLTADLTRARVMVDKAIDSLKRWNAHDQKVFRKWFGTTSAGARATVLSGFENMKRMFGVLTPVNYQYDPSIDALGWYARTHPHQWWATDLGTAYFGLGPNARSTTLIHEASHLTLVASTNSIFGEPPSVYGWYGARQLAITNSAAALNNADSFGFFAVQSR